MENFNLKKFLVENKLTTNSKMFNEGMFQDLKNFGKGLLNQPTFDDDNVERDENKIFDEIKNKYPDLFAEFDKPLMDYLDHPRSDKRRQLAYRVFDSFDVASKFGSSKKAFEDSIVNYWKELTGKSETVNEEMDFESSNQIQAVINHLIDTDRQDILDVLESIPEWNELVTQAADY